MSELKLLVNIHSMVYWPIRSNILVDTPSISEEFTVWLDIGFKKERSSNLLGIV